MSKRLAGYGSHLYSSLLMGLSGTDPGFLERGVHMCKGACFTNLPNLEKKIIDLSSLAKQNLAVSNNWWRTNYNVLTKLLTYI